MFGVHTCERSSMMWLFYLVCLYVCISASSCSFCVSTLCGSPFQLKAVVHHEVLLRSARYLSFSNASGELNFLSAVGIRSFVIC